MNPICTVGSRTYSSRGKGTVNKFHTSGKCPTASKAMRPQLDLQNHLKKNRSKLTQRTEHEVKRLNLTTLKDSITPIMTTKVLQTVALTLSIYL